MRPLNLQIALGAMTLICGCQGEPPPKSVPSGFEALERREASKALVPVPVVKAKEEATPSASRSLLSVGSLGTTQTTNKATTQVRKIELPVQRSLAQTFAGIKEGNVLLKAVDAAVLPRFDIQRLKQGDTIEIWVEGSSLIAFRVPARDPIFAMRWGEAFFDSTGHSLDGPILTRALSVTRVTSAYGARFHPVLRKSSRHEGVDYGAKKGTPIFSVADGAVVFAKMTRTGGNVIRVAHPKRYLSTYMHLDAFAPSIKKGSNVKRGQVIGYVGATGRVTGPHLHYELRFDGVVVDPLNWTPTPFRALGPRSKVEFLKALDALP